MKMKKIIICCFLTISMYVDAQDSIISSYGDTIITEKYAKAFLKDETGNYEFNVIVGNDTITKGLYFIRSFITNNLCVSLSANKLDINTFLLILNHISKKYDIINLDIISLGEFPKEFIIEISRKFGRRKWNTETCHQLIKVFKDSKVYDILIKALGAYCLEIKDISIPYVWETKINKPIIKNKNKEKTERLPSPLLSMTVYLTIHRKIESHFYY